MWALICSLHLRPAGTEQQWHDSWAPRSVAPAAPAWQRLQWIQTEILLFLMRENLIVQLQDKYFSFLWKSGFMKTWWFKNQDEVFFFFFAENLIVQKRISRFPFSRQISFERRFPTPPKSETFSETSGNFLKTRGGKWNPSEPETDAGCSDLLEWLHYRSRVTRSNYLLRQVKP